MLDWLNSLRVCRPPRPLTPDEHDVLVDLVKGWEKVTRRFDRAREKNGPWGCMVESSAMDEGLEKIVEACERHDLRTHWIRAVLKIATNVADEDEERQLA